MKRKLAILIIPWLVLSLPSCALLKKWFKPHPKVSATPEKVVEGPKNVGIIASISPDKKFVLIRSYGTWATETGSILTTRGTDERTANLLVTGEKLGEFAAADIQAGAVEVGDAVYSRHVPKPVAPENPAQPTPAGEKHDSPNVQKNN